jgi:hypothetical protein
MSTKARLGEALGGIIAYYSEGRKKKCAQSLVAVVDIVDDLEDELAAARDALYELAAMPPSMSIVEGIRLLGARASKSETGRPDPTTPAAAQKRIGELKIEIQRLSWIITGDPADDGAWTCQYCGFVGFWEGGSHCSPLDKA